MTDLEIKKALECCANELGCKKCPANPHKGNYGFCTPPLIKSAFDLITRQQAEIEKLKKDNRLFPDLGRMYRGIRAEAVEEFAEMLKEKAMQKFGWNEYVEIEEIVNLVKEMENET